MKPVKITKQDREFIKIFSKSEIRTTGLKIDPVKTLDMGGRKK